MRVLLPLLIEGTRLSKNLDSLGDVTHCYVEVHPSTEFIKTKLVILISVAIKYSFSFVEGLSNLSKAIMTLSDIRFLHGVCVNSSQCTRVTHPCRNTNILLNSVPLLYVSDKCDVGACMNSSQCTSVMHAPIIAGQKLGPRKLLFLP